MITRPRSWYIGAAIVGWSGSVLRVVHDLYVTPGTHHATLGLYGPYRAGLLGGLQQVGDDLSYFTHWSNIVNAIALTLLALNPQRDSVLFRALRNTSVVMITMTGILYAVLIAPTAHVVGWFDNTTNFIIHYLNPPLAILIWVFCGPRGWFKWRDVWRIYPLPVGYLMFTLVRGAITHRYPYAFFNVVHLGYAPVLTSMATIIVESLVIVALFIGADHLLTRRDHH
jgi:hypothetical protein